MSKFVYGHYARQEGRNGVKDADYHGQRPGRKTEDTQRTGYQAHGRQGEGISLQYPGPYGGRTQGAGHICRHWQPGAESAVLVDKATASLISENARHTHLAGKAEVMGADVYAAISRLAGVGRSFSLIFCDPPYHKGLWERALSAIDASDLLAYEGILVVEHGADENEYPELRNLQLALNKRYGHTTQLSFFQRKDYLQACEEAES